MQQRVRTNIAILVTLITVGIFFQVNLFSYISGDAITTRPSSSSDAESSLPTFSITGAEVDKRVVKIKSAVYPANGFVVIKKIGAEVELPIIGVSQFLSGGVATDILVILSESGTKDEWLVTDFYRDDGDGTFSPYADAPLLNERGEPESIPFK